MNEKGKSRAMVVAVLALVISVVGLFVPARKPDSGGISTQQSARAVLGLLERVEKTGELHAGYGVYPPYTQEDPNTKVVSGFSVDIINQLANELQCKVVWHRLNWNASITQNRIHTEARRERKDIEKFSLRLLRSRVCKMREI